MKARLILQQECKKLFYHLNATMKSGRLLSKQCTGFILGNVYEACHPVCPSDEEFLSQSLLILIDLPNKKKCAPAKKNYKIELCALLKLSSQHTNCTVCELWKFS